MNQYNKHGIKVFNANTVRKQSYGSGVDDTFDRLKIFDKTRGRCYYCGDKMPYKKMTIDHVEPKYKGGTEKFENLVPACWGCNQDKANLTLDEYRKRVFGDTDEQFYGEKENEQVNQNEIN